MSPAPGVPDLSVIIPVYNEEQGLPLLFARLYPALEALGRSYELVFVDDGSRDRSAAVLRDAVGHRPEVTRALLLSYNVGQHLAIVAGFGAARGRYLITLDADLQNPPEEIGRLLAELDAGADYVGTIRKQRQDVAWRRAASRLLNRIRESSTSIRITDQGCMLRGYSRPVVDAVLACDEVSTFVPALAYTFARHPVEIEVGHEERAVGTTQYSLYRLIRLNFDLMTGFSLVPLQLVSMLGVLVAIASLLFVLVLAVRRLVYGPEAEGLFTLFGIAFFLMGVLLFGLGVVGEYVGRIYLQVRHRPRYVVGEALGGGTPPGRAAIRAEDLVGEQDPQRVREPRP